MCQSNEKPLATPMILKVSGIYSVVMSRDDLDERINNFKFILVYKSST